MERQSYQNLRFEIESEVLSFFQENPNGPLSQEYVTTDLVNSLSRLFLIALSNHEVKRQQKRREFLTFRRRPDVTVPGWAFRKPGN